MTRSRTDQPATNTQHRVEQHDRRWAGDARERLLADPRQGAAAGAGRRLDRRTGKVTARRWSCRTAGGFRGPLDAGDPELVRTHRVVALDLPGHGASEVADGWTPTTCSGGSGADRAHLPVPARAGGPWAWRRYRGPLAIAHPDRLSGLVLVDAFGLSPFAGAALPGLALNRFLEQLIERTAMGCRAVLVDLGAASRWSAGSCWRPTPWTGRHAGPEGRTRQAHAAVRAAGDPGDGAGADRCSHHPCLGATGPPGAAADRRGRQRLPLAAARDRQRW